MTAITAFVDLDRRGRVAVITVNNPPDNALSHGVRQGLKDGIVAASSDATVNAIVLRCAGQTFITGTDTTEFRKPPQEPGLHEVLDLIEGSAKAVVAAIHGTALRGGLEVALACHYRIGVQGTRFGLDEVTMGLLPGAGATQRLPRVVGVARERELFLELLHSPESNAQRYIFRAERDAATIPGLPADTPAREIRKAAVIGAGTMGGGIAMTFANVGIPVTLVEVAQAALDRGLAVVRKNYENTAARGRLTAQDVEQRMSRITGTTDVNAVADADIIVEAVFEEMPIKQEVFATLDRIAKSDAVLATGARAVSPAV